MRSSAPSDSDDSGDEGPFRWGTCVVVMSPHPLAASHALVTHASTGAYGIRLLARKAFLRHASVPTAFLSSHSRDVDVHKASVRTYRAYLAIQSGPPHHVPPISFAPSQPVSFGGTTFQPSDWLEAWARWDSTWLRALVAPTRTDHHDTPTAYVVMWDARHLSADFSPDDIHIEHTDACNHRIRRERLLASTALAPGSTTAHATATDHQCIICGAVAAATEGPWHSAHTVREADTSVTTRHTTTTVDTIPAPGATTTTETTTLTETTTTITKHITTTTRTTRTVHSGYPRGLPLALHALYDQCSRACGTLVVCSTCRLTVCVPCFVAHFPFDAHCDLIPISRASPCLWQCPRCDAPVPPLGTPLSPPQTRP